MHWNDCNVETIRKKFKRNRPNNHPVMPHVYDHPVVPHVYDHPVVPHIYDRPVVPHVYDRPVVPHVYDHPVVPHVCGGQFVAQWNYALCILGQRFLVCGNGRPDRILLFGTDGGFGFLSNSRDWFLYGAFKSGLQSVAGYLGLALVFVWGGALRGGLIAIFIGLFATVGGIFILAGGLGAGLSFYGVKTLS